MAKTPPGWPDTIAIAQKKYLNWSWEIDVKDLWTCTPKSAADVVTVCNWAKDHGYQVRPRGIMHGWSPLTIAGTTSPGAKIILVDTTQHLTKMTFIPRTATSGPQVKVGAGATMLKLLKFLEEKTEGKGKAKGHSFPHTPAPGNLTVGGVLAINAHGTAIPSPGDSFPCSYGSLSNQILAFTAVVTDPKSSNPSQYSLRTFTRGEGDDIALLTHLGRAFLVDATLQVIDNYNLRCQSYTDIPASTLFAAASSSSSSGPSANSMADFLSKSGRVEAIWYPFTDKPWLKVWSHAPTKPKGTRQVAGPFNYGFSDHLPDFVTALFKDIVAGHGDQTPKLAEMMAFFTDLGLTTSNARDLWGP